MMLKKIHPELQAALAANGMAEPGELLSETFSTLKSGAGCGIVAPSESGKTTLQLVNVIQRLQKPEGESTRALLIVEDKEHLLATLEMFERLNTHNNLRVYGTNDKMDIDQDKNLISLGNDVLIGTPGKVNALFGGAGFNLNTVKIFAVDDADRVFTNRQDALIRRVAESAKRPQFVFTATKATEKVESMASRLMQEPAWFEFE